MYIKATARWLQFGTKSKSWCKTIKHKYANRLLLILWRSREPDTGEHKCRKRRQTAERLDSLLVSYKSKFQASVINPENVLIKETVPDTSNNRQPPNFSSHQHHHQCRPSLPISLHRALLTSSNTPILTVTVSRHRVPSIFSGA